MRQVTCALVLAVAAGPLTAAELSTLATLAVQGPVEALEKAFQQPGQAIKVQFDTSPNITKRLAAGEMPDVLIAQTSTVDQLIKGGRAIAATPAAIGKIGVGTAGGNQVGFTMVSEIRAR